MTEKKLKAFEKILEAKCQEFLISVRRSTSNFPGQFVNGGDFWSWILCHPSEFGEAPPSGTNMRGSLVANSEQIAKLDGRVVDVLVGMSIANMLQEYRRLLEVKLEAFNGVHREFIG